MVNRRIALFLVVLVAACSREQRTPEPPPSAPITATHAAAAPVVPAGSYQSVLDRFRISPGFHFTFNDGEGSLKRPRQGMEQLRTHVTRGPDRGDWLAEVKPNGVVWTKDGKHTVDVPQSLQRLYQRLTIFPDPQKKEGTAQRNGNHFEFTDANGGDRYVITVGPDDRITEIRIGETVIGIDEKKA
jgi:hypothetical protein